MIAFIIKSHDMCWGYIQIDLSIQTNHYTKYRASFSKRLRRFGNQSGHALRVKALIKSVGGLLLEINT